MEKQNSQLIQKTIQVYKRVQNQTLINQTVKILSNRFIISLLQKKLVVMPTLKITHAFPLHNPVLICFLPDKQNLFGLKNPSCHLLAQADVLKSVRQNQSNYLQKMQKTCKFTHVKEVLQLSSFITASSTSKFWRRNSFYILQNGLLGNKGQLGLRKRLYFKVLI